MVGMPFTIIKLTRKDMGIMAKITPFFIFGVPINNLVKKYPKAIRSIIKTYMMIQLIIKPVTPRLSSINSQTNELIMSIKLCKTNF